MTEFTYKSARSGSFVAGISAVLVIETTALHFALVGRHPAIAWTLTTFNLWAIVWFVRDYVAMGQRAVSLVGDVMRLRIGRRFDVTLSTGVIERVIKPTYKDLPTPGTNQGHDYVNLTKPAQPNVLLILREPVAVRMPGGVKRHVRRLALHLDDAEGFAASV